ncbi:beta-hydroxyacyl-ACP dehydratase [Chlamydiia bacterium]|nr:beta-hydroxyacyl-ACP dehydratase [Chlamydiia bacterium]
MNPNKQSAFLAQINESYIMTHDDICQCIMHDPPAVLLDGVYTLSETEIVCGKYLSPEDFFFNGHFKDNPIYPAHVGIELVAQSGLVLMMKKHAKNSSIPMIIGIERAKFRKPMLPADQLCIKVNIRHKSQYVAS